MNTETSRHAWIAAGGASLIAAALFGAPGCTSTTPRGSLWTIQCLEVEGEHRAARCEAVAETLRRTPGVRSTEVFVEEGSDEIMRLYYGAYKRPVDRKTGKRPYHAQMRRDLELLRRLGDDSGRRYFVRAIPVRMPMPDVGNPEWNLASMTGAYTLQVAVFEPTDEFGDYKRAAAELCAYLRSKGHDAYYFHGSASSMVTVGVFGEDAVTVDSMGRATYSPKVQTLQRDELLKYNYVNGGIMRVKNDDGVMVPVYSGLVRIPKPSGRKPS